MGLTFAFIRGQARECEPGRQIECIVKRSVLWGWSFHLEIDLAVNNVHNVAAHPDFFAVLA
jgi:hypothetical protein